MKNSQFNATIRLDSLGLGKTPTNQLKNKDWGKEIDTSTYYRLGFSVNSVVCIL